MKVVAAKSKWHRSHWAHATASCRSGTRSTGATAIKATTTCSAPPREDEDEISEQICDELQIASGDEKRTRIYGPLAIGNHVDHQHAYRAGLCLHKRGYDVWYYEDLPYSLKPEHLSAREDFLTLDLIAPGPIVDVSSVWDRKIDAIMAYPSQLAVIFEQYVGVGASRVAISDAMSSYAKSAGDGKLAERFWTISG